MLNASFKPDDNWFAFDEDTGKTIKRNFPDAAAAFAWIHADRLRNHTKHKGS